MGGRPETIISIPSNNAGFDRDHAHRKLTIDFHIALVRWVREQNGNGNSASCDRVHDPLSLATFDRYFEMTGANRTNDSLRPRLTSKTKVRINRKKHVIPDATFVIKDRRLISFGGSAVVSTQNSSNSIR